MCGRADDNLGLIGWETLNDVFGRQGWELETMRHEIRPTDPLRIVRRTGGRFEAAFGRWGLVPHGMGLGEARKFASFNARIETVHEKPMFRTAFQTQRYVIPIARFWE
ncbi:SOS response-associated peptidase [Deinococcus sp. KSM4-11]|nr:SOS response-associated peptidase [Deinococcus sp. KSM4-11]